MSTVISVENLSKKYIIGHQKQERYTSLRDVLTDGAKSFTHKLIHPFDTQKTDSTHEEFWALKDVSFDIQQGDRVGIIGRNGAGKSTLLKILSRITEPTSGKVSINGRVASLLEVGTGFHPELSGRENIFLNGAILGMSKAEIKKKFDEIVAFAEVAKFLDTPVKRYSSGMYVRLAFAVAAHLEPEILIVDEVLAVGDAQFQKKCLGKMEEVGKEGRTVVFVSHNMNAIEQFCSSAICLEKGLVKTKAEEVRKVITTYLQDGVNQGHKSEWINTEGSYKNPFFIPNRLSITDRNGITLNEPVSNEASLFVCLEAEISELDSSLTVGFAIYSEEGNLLYWSYQTDSAQDIWPILRRGDNKLMCELPKRMLNEGRYRLEIIGGLHHRQWLFEPGSSKAAVEFVIQGGLSDSPYWLAKRPGILAPVLAWRLT